MSREIHAGCSVGAPVLIDDLVGGDRAAGDGAVGHGKSGVGGQRPCGDEDPARAVGALRGRQRAGREVARRRDTAPLCDSGVSMVGAAERRGIQHVEPAVGVRRARSGACPYAETRPGEAVKARLPGENQSFGFSVVLIERDHRVGVVRAGRGAAVGRDVAGCRRCRRSGRRCRRRSRRWRSHCITCFGVAARARAA